MDTHFRGFERNFFKKFFAEKSIPSLICTRGIKMDTHFRLVLQNFFNIFYPFTISKWDWLLYTLKGLIFWKFLWKNISPFTCLNWESRFVPPFFRKISKIKRPPTRDTFSVSQVSGLMNLFLIWKEPPKSLRTVMFWGDFWAFSFDMNVYFSAVDNFIVWADLMLFVGFRATKKHRK